MKKLLLGCLFTIGALSAVDSASAQSYYAPNGYANTTPAIRYSNPYTAPTIYYSGRAAMSGASAGASMYGTAVSGGAMSPLVPYNVIRMYDYTGRAYQANQQRQSYVYPASPWRR